MATPAESLARSVLEWWGLLLGWDSFSLDDIAKRFNLASERAEFGPDAELWPFAFEAMTGLMFRNGPETPEDAVKYIKSWFDELQASFPPAYIRIIWVVTFSWEPERIGLGAMGWSVQPSVEALMPEWGETEAEAIDYLLHTFVPFWVGYWALVSPEWEIVDYPVGSSYGYSAQLVALPYTAWLAIRNRGDSILQFQVSPADLTDEHGNLITIPLDTFTNDFSSAVLEHCQAETQTRAAPSLALTEAALNGNVIRLFGEDVWAELNATIEGVE